MYGLIHSIDTFSTLDGPGIRTVIFMQGCHLRCQYCHNPDTWAIQSNNAKRYRVNELMQIILRSKPYFANQQGGITFSGGEPLLQTDFIRSVLENCQTNGIHTALDSSLYVKTSLLKKVLPYTNLFLADIKHFDSDKSHKLTGLPNDLNLANLRLLSAAHIPIWIRYVVVPGLTDDKTDVIKLANFIKSLNSVERIDLLPYHTLGVHKWDILAYQYELDQVLPPSAEDIKSIQNIIANITNIKVYANI